MPNWYIIAGEASGDLHGSNLVKALLAQKPDLTFRGIGGDQMKAAGVQLVKHIQETNFMGFWEVITHLPTIWKLFSLVENDIIRYQAEAVVLIDYPGFNLRLAKFLKKQGIRVLYYISPQLWAWKKGRIQIIRDCVERLYCILPFEKDFYAKENLEVDYVGHPLLDALTSQSIQPLYSEKVIALLPGSRKQEISRMLPVMLETTTHFPNEKFVIAGAPSLDKAFYQPFLRKYPSVQFVQNQTYPVLASAKAALVTSGTATLETALWNVPEVVCYAGEWFSYQIAKRIVSVPYISLVNLILARQAVKELI
ncbi:MAG: lipid-A-disaccharide synthase, partial [Bacteroidia bacterium]|nr:lipid-A-disaccharide synthase [Bacteroidia bacterium]